MWRLAQLLPASTRVHLAVPAVLRWPLITCSQVTTRTPRTRDCCYPTVDYKWNLCVNCPLKMTWHPITACRAGSRPVPDSTVATRQIITIKGGFTIDNKIKLIKIK
ncbi:hypothetical protein B566_EDAN011606 [Ephemera danica]|nr:hypothetical protein B566_EDAN011606 [Ephemera danica]